MNTEMPDIATTLIEKLNLEVLETIDLPGQPERRTPLPVALTNGPLANVLPSIISDGTAWSHQSLALERLFARDNIVMETGPASGKSDVFQLYSFHRILEDDQAKVLVFYPTKALASDQFARWRGMATKFGIDANKVVRIDGDSDMPSADRGEALDQARIVLMTPDVCQAWLMRAVGSALVRRFLERLVLLVLDEAHEYESVFGSNVAFLLRRMISAKRRATQKGSEQRRLQV